MTGRRQYVTTDDVSKEMMLQRLIAVGEIVIVEKVLALWVISLIGCAFQIFEVQVEMHDPTFTSFSITMGSDDCKVSSLKRKISKKISMTDKEVRSFNNNFIQLIKRYRSSNYLTRTARQTTTLICRGSH